MTTLRPFGLGIVGALLVLAGWHLYQDHRDLHILFTVVAQAQAQARAAQIAPAPAPAPPKD